MLKRRSVVIVGGGFAGTSAARALSGRLPPDVDLTLISEESYTTFNPMLPEAVGASIFPEQVVAPLRELLMPDERRRFIMGRVTGTDRTLRRLRCETLSGELEVPYDHLVLAFGNRARLDLLPGMAEHALPLKTVGDALEIRNVVLRRIARIELETDVAKRESLGHFIVIGGGFSGVEVAGELVDCLGSIRRFYPRVRATELRVTVLHDGDRLLPELPASLGAAALKSLRQRKVDVRLGARAKQVSELGVGLVGGAMLEASTVIGTIGTMPNSLIHSLRLPTERGRISVANDLAVPGQIGHMKGVAEVFGFPLSGLAAWMLWRAYYLSQMPTPRRKLRIFVEWTWGMFFPTDITHLRFPGSRAVHQAEHDHTDGAKNTEYAADSH